MTQPEDGSAALPLAVRCSPDGRFVEAMRALVGRVAAAAGPGAQTEPFVLAMHQVIPWLLTRVSDDAATIGFGFAREGGALVAEMRWSPGAIPAPAATDLPSLAADVQVTCGVEGDQAICRVSCRCV
ncbi:MAG: hypothetical protein ACR2LU_05115 [Luteitalea sp.]|nr:hypothetical protein [Acidobacteriota bacterium]